MNKALFTCKNCGEKFFEKDAIKVKQGYSYIISCPKCGTLRPVGTMALSLDSDKLAEEGTKPKFKEGDRITNGIATLTILTLASDRYIVEDNFGECGTIYFNYQDGWKIMEEETKPKLGTALNPIEPKSNTNSIIQSEIDVIEKAKTYWDSIKDAWICPEGYHFKDENGNVINATKIVLEKKLDDKLKLESTKKVREYWSEYTRIFVEIYDDEPNECVLTHLYTLEDHRQKGYGRQALIEAELIAKELGCHTAYLKVEIDSWMHEWYLRMGYKWYKTADKEHIWLIKNL